ncbi:MAG: hypothetical protein J1F05_06970 [Muribaculaceae bacterium]|nr:hypothetical protein [Muribaculaceae bacterium]
MIKVGIYGPDAVNDPVRKQLLRLLLRHPDVDLRAVASPAGNTVPLSILHPVYAGETDLTLERVLNLDGLDVLFVIDEENITEEIREKFNSDENFRLIVIGNADHLRADRPAEFVYGLPEYYRKALVRDARAAVSPRAEAMLIELALLPLAKNEMLNAPVEVMMATNRPWSLDDATEEARVTLQQVQPSFIHTITSMAADEAPFERLDLVARLETPIAIEEIERLYNEAYEDHSFVYLLPDETTIDEDLRGSNKCLIQLSRGADGVLIVKATLDALTKGCTGTAVHLMDLLFGLYERTGLSI